MYLPTSCQTLHGESVVVGTLVVHLRRTEGGEGEQMVLAQLLGEGEEVVPSAEVGALNVAVAPSLAAHDCERPTVGRATGGKRESELVVSVIAHAVGEGSSPCVHRVVLVTMLIDPPTEGVDTLAAPRPR